MSDSKQYIFIAIMVLVPIILSVWQYGSSNGYPLLYRYILAVAIVWIMILGIARFAGGLERLNMFALVGAGYWI